MQRTLLLFTLPFLFLAPLHAQSIELTFAAELDGADVPLDSIRITDLTTGSDTALYAPDHVLLLVAGTGITEATSSGLTGLANHPNPFSGTTRVELMAGAGGAVHLTVSDLAGRVVAAYAGVLPPGAHAFLFEGGTGAYVLDAALNGAHRTIRMVGTRDAGQEQARIRYAGAGPQQGVAKAGGAFQWSPGDLLQFIGYGHGDIPYSGLIEDAASVSGSYVFAALPGLLCPEGPSVSDIDGHGYPVVHIGSQCWMGENLRTGSYRNGDAIPQVTDDAAWAALSGGAWCNYANEEGNDAVYGKLYNWYTVNDARGVCPQGWRVPTDDDWKQLELALGMTLGDLDVMGLRSSGGVGGKIKSTSDLWEVPNTGATNESGFSALPAGNRNGYIGSFATLGIRSPWWSATSPGSGDGLNRTLDNDNAGIYRVVSEQHFGYPVRCVQE